MPSHYRIDVWSSSDTIESTGERRLAIGSALSILSSLSEDQRHLFAEQCGMRNLPPRPLSRLPVEAGEG